jgi:membrane-associated phospholipid phosphatase
MDLADAVSLTILAAFGYPVLLAIRGVRFYQYLTVGLLGLNVLVAGVKQLTHRLLTTDVVRRPTGAHGCDLFCIGGPVGGAAGVPSGHMATVSMFVFAVWMKTGRSDLFWWGVLWIAAMAWSRWAKQCHTLIQIGAGTALGAGSGIVLFLALR